MSAASIPRQVDHAGPAVAATALLSCVFGAAPLSAQTTVIPPVPVVGQVSALCVLGDPEVLAGGGANISAIVGGTVNIASLVDEDLTTRATRFEVELPALCNRPHRLTIRSDNGGLWHAAPGRAGPDFGDGVPYRIDIKWAGLDRQFFVPAQSVAETNSNTPVSRPSGGTLGLSFSIDAGASNAGANVPLVAGTYRDTIRISMSAD